MTQLARLAKPSLDSAMDWITAKVANKQGIGEKREAKLGLPNIGDTTPVAYCMRQLYYLQCLTVSLTLFSLFHVDPQDKRLLYHVGPRHPRDTVQRSA